MIENMIGTDAIQDDHVVEETIRPITFADFPGQGPVVERLQLYIEAARRRGDELDHILLHGPPGLGKTTLAAIVANEMGTGFRPSSGTLFQSPLDLSGILTNLGERDILFIDELHRVSSSAEEYLYPAMEDYTIDIVIDQGPKAKSVRLNLDRFTLIGATTRLGLLTAPLRSRFGIVERLQFYQAGDLVTILERSARILGIQMEDGAAEEIATRSRGTPRIANRLARRIRDFADVRTHGIVTHNIAKDALEMLDVDCRGLDDMDRKILSTLIDNFGGGPVGLSTLSAAVGEEPGAIEDVHEPWLIQEGWLERTSRGRRASTMAQGSYGREHRER